MAEELPRYCVRGRAFPATAIWAESLNVLEDVEASVLRAEGPVAAVQKAFQIRLEIELPLIEVVQPDWLCLQLLERVREALEVFWFWVRAYVDVLGRPHISVGCHGVAATTTKATEWSTSACEERLGPQRLGHASAWAARSVAISLNWAAWERRCAGVRSR